MERIPMLILKPGKQEGICFPDPANPLDFKSTGNIPIHPEEAVKADIAQQIVEKDRPPLQLRTEVAVVISGDSVTICEGAETEGELLLEGSTVVLFPNREYFFRESCGETFLSFIWLSRS